MRTIAQLQGWRVVLLACVPTLFVLWRADAATRSKPKRLLSEIATSSNALVNISAADIPASPDLLELGRSATPALGRCLADNPAEALRAECGDLLGVLGDPLALPQLHAALEDWDAQVRLHAIRSIGRLADAASVVPLLVAAQRSDETEDNRLATLRALGSIANAPALAGLRKVLRTPEQKETLRTAAFAELWRNRRAAPREIVGDVEYALGSKSPRLVYAGAVRAAALANPRLASALRAHIDNTDANIRNKTIRALGMVGDRRAVPLLVARLRLARDARLLNNLAFALERIDRRAFFAQMERLVGHPLAIIRFNAVFVIGDVRRAEGAPLLLRALRDPSDRVRLEAAKSAAKLPVSRPLLERALADREQSVREVAADSAAKLGDAVLLARALGDQEPEVRRLAVEGLATVAAPAELLAIALRDQDEAVRIAAMKLAIVHQAPPLALIASAIGDGSMKVRGVAIEGVRRHRIATALPALEPLIADPHAPLHEDAIYASDAATPGGRSDLIYDALFVSDDAPARQRAAETLAKRGDGRVHDFIVACLLANGCPITAATPLLAHESDPSVIRRLQLAWVRQRDDLSPLIAKLRPPGTNGLALAELETSPPSEPQRLYRSVAFLEQLGEPATRTLLTARLDESDLWQRLHLLAALDRLGAPDARRRLLSTFDGAPVEWLPAAAGVLGELTAAAQQQALDGELAQREAGPQVPLALAAAAVRLYWHPDTVPERLLQALASLRPREGELARRYLRGAKTETLHRAAARERLPVVREELERLLGRAG